MSPRPYGSAARAYFTAGYWPLPLPPRKKASPPEGYTGRAGREVTAEDVSRWLAQHRSGNIGLRLPPGVAGIDVDAYKGADHAAAWEELTAQCGPLPPAPWCSSRDDGISGVRLFRVPVDWEGAAKLPAGSNGISPGEVIQPHHRYVVCPPSIHPETGRAYRWRSCSITKVADLPALPEPWLDALSLAAAVPAQPAARPASTARACDKAGTRPGDDFNERADWLADILGPHGWRLHHENNGTVYVTRPGKSVRDGHSATIGHSNDGVQRLFVFSADAAPFEPETPYTKFSAYALLNHGGDHRAAARELGRIGYGTPRPVPTPAGPVGDTVPWPDGPAPAGSGDDDAEFQFDPADPIAPIRAVENVDPDKRVAAVGKAIRAMAACGMDALTEATVRDYVVRNNLLPRSDFRRIVKEARPYSSANRSHVHTPASPAETTADDGCRAEGCEATPPAWVKGCDILDGLVKELEKRCGLTGEHRNAKLLYLAVVSRVLDNPASAAVKGLPSAGKSYTVECVLAAFPSSAVITVTAMSEHALVYMRESFAHRTLVLYEATALREGREKTDGNQTAMFIRTLLSEGKIVYPTVLKEPVTGDLVTKVIEKDGPTNFIVTTTATSLHPENETRMLSLAADDSKSQTTAVMKAIARKKKRTSPDFSDWHALDHWIRYHASHQVDVPYAHWLAENIPPVAVRLRRDFATLLTLIEAHAIVHQLDRDTDSQGRIIASQADYLAVRELVADLMSDAVGSTVKASVRETVEIIAGCDPETGMTVMRLADQLRIERSAAQYRVKAAREGGYILNIEEKGNKPARYVPAAQLPDEVILLPKAIPDAHLHGSHPQTAPDSAKPQVAARCEGVNGQRGGKAPFHQCSACGGALDPKLAAAGITTHPNCEEVPAA